MVDHAHLWDARTAAEYDTPGEGMFDPAVLGPTVRRLSELAAGGRALELAIGTGRVAIPLREAGVEVSGIELSEAMLARLREKAGAEDIPVELGDMTTTHAGEGFSLVSHHVRFEEQVDGSREATIGRTPQRYVWPSELDLMAQLAGFTLESRWADWDCSEFTGASRSHVSVYRFPTLVR